MRGLANPDGLVLDERHPEMAMKRGALDGEKYFLRPSRKSPRTLARVTKRGDKEEEEERNNLARVTKRGDQEEEEEEERNNYVRVV